MSVESFQELFDYTYWGRDRILAAATVLTPEQRTAPTWLDHGSIHGTLVHQYASEVLLRERWEGLAPVGLLDETDIPRFDVLQERWQEHETRVRRFLDGLDDAGLARPVRYRSRAGFEYADPLHRVLFQLVNHGTQHRSEVALALTHLGHSPGFMDYMAYVRERNPG